MSSTLGIYFRPITFKILTTALTDAYVGLFLSGLCYNIDMSVFSPTRKKNGLVSQSEI